MHNPSRRRLLTGAVTAALATGVAANAAAICVAPPVAGDPIRDAADRLADMMAARHGRESWKVHIDHDAGGLGFVMIMPNLGGPA